MYISEKKKKKNNYVEIGILCDVVPPAVSECRTTFINTCLQQFATQNVNANYKQIESHQCYVLKTCMLKWTCV